MSALRMIAWGMAQPDEATIAMLRKAVRVELTAHGLTLRGIGNKQYRLLHHRRKFQKTGRRDVRAACGTLEVCCLAALKLIEPHNYPTR